MARTTSRSAACPACGGPGEDRHFEIEDRDLFRCTLCRTEFLVNSPVRPQLQKDFWDGYKFEIYADEGVQAQYAAQYAAIFDALEQHGGPVHSVLDVGCGIGNFVKWAQDRGLDAVGADVEDSAITTARERGLKVWNADELPEHVPDASIDVLTLWDVIEHVADPRDFLAGLLRFVRPGGLVVLEVPDGAFPLRPVAIGVRKVVEPIRISDMLYHRGHRTYFTGRGLSTLLARCGLDVVDEQGIRSPSRKMAQLFDVWAERGSGAGRLGPVLYRGLDRGMRLVGMTNKLIMVGRVPES
jgi:SAM-dependent methyltransferase